MRKGRWHPSLFYMPYQWLIFCNSFNSQNLGSVATFFGLPIVPIISFNLNCLTFEAFFYFPVLLSIVSTSQLINVFFDSFSIVLQLTKIHFQIHFQLCYNLLKFWYVGIVTKGISLKQIIILQKLKFLTGEKISNNSLVKLSLQKALPLCSYGIC